MTACEWLQCVAVKVARLHLLFRGGMARIEIELLPQKEITTKAVATLRQQKEQVLATAQAEATRIEGQIQSLLAIEHVAEA